MASAPALDFRRDAQIGHPWERRRVFKPSKYRRSRQKSQATGGLQTSSLDWSRHVDALAMQAASLTRFPEGVGWRVTQGLAKGSRHFVLAETLLHPGPSLEAQLLVGPFIGVAAQDELGHVFRP